MVFLEQRALCDISEMLMDLRRVVAAHGEFLAEFGQRTLIEEPPDSPYERSPSHQPWNTRPPDQQPVMGPQRGWSLLPSVTTAPLGIQPEALPRLRLEPPRFDGEHALDWIGKIQRYYNHHYTPLDDRLYLTQYLFDHPASDWREYWVETNKGKSWEDFLLAVHDRFAPELNEDESLEANTNEACKAGDIVVNPIFDSGNIVVEGGGSVFNTASESDQSAETVAMRDINDVDSRDDDDFQGANRHIRWVSGDINPFKPAETRELMSDGTYYLDDRLEVPRMLPMCNALPRDIIPIENLECRENSLEVVVDDGLVATIVSEESHATVEDDELMLEFELTIFEGKETALVLDPKLATNVISFASQWKSGVVGLSAGYGMVSQFPIDAMCEREMMWPKLASKIILAGYFVDATIVKQFGWKEILIGYDDSYDRRKLVSYFGVMNGVRIFDPGILRVFPPWRRHSCSYFITHLEGKVVFNGGRVDRVLEHLNHVKDRIQISLNIF